MECLRCNIDIYSYNCTSIKICLQEAKSALYNIFKIKYCIIEDLVIVCNRTSIKNTRILQFKENVRKIEVLRMEDNQKFCEPDNEEEIEYEEILCEVDDDEEIKYEEKFCELDSDEDNEKRIEYEEGFRQYLKCNFTNEDGLFVKEEINEKTKVSLTDLGKHLFGYLCVTSNIPYKEIKYYLYLIQKRKPIKNWKIKGSQMFNWLENNLINFKLDKTPKIKTLDENEIFKMSESIMMFMAVFESMDNRLKKKDTAYFGKEIKNADCNYIQKYCRKENIEGKYIKKYILKDDYTLFSIMLMYFVYIIFYRYFNKELCIRKDEKTDTIQIENIVDIMSVIHKDWVGTWKHEQKVHIENPKKDIEQQIRQYIIENFFSQREESNFSFDGFPYMKFLIINNQFSEFTDEIIKDFAIWIYKKNHCETKHINSATIIVDDIKDHFQKVVKNVYYGENYDFRNEEERIGNEDVYKKNKLNILSLFSILKKKENNDNIQSSIPKTLRASRNRIEINGEKINRLRLFIDDMLTDDSSNYREDNKDKEYKSMINCIGGYEFERIFQPINFMLDSVISIKMYEDKNFRNKINEIRHYDNADRYKYIVNVTNYSSYPVFLGIYLKRLYLQTEINIEKYVANYISNHCEHNCNGCDNFCKYEAKKENLKKEKIEDFEKEQQGKEKREKKKLEKNLDINEFAVFITDRFRKNSSGMLNIENNYTDVMLSETFRYKNIDKDMRLSVRVKDSFIRYDGYAWLEEFEDVNTEWINECICLGEFFENIMKEMSEYLEQICEKEDIIAWSRNVVEECKKEDDINKLSEHLYGIWNDVYKYAIDNKLAITKVRNEYFEKYFSSLKNERRQEEEELI